MFITFSENLKNLKNILSLFVFWMSNCPILSLCWNQICHGNNELDDTLESQWRYNYKMLHSTCLYIIEMLEFIAKQRLAPPKSETLSDSHYALSLGLF